MTSNEFSIYFGPGVADVLRHADQMIKDARYWIGTADFHQTYQSEQNRPTWPELDHKVEDMELSLLCCLRLMINLAAGTGQVRLTRDSDNSLQFHQPATGLTGGMIYHPDKIDDAQIPIGTWTLHS